MLKHLIVAMVLMTTPTYAEDITPQYVKENYPLALSGPCKDNESGERGGCYMFLRPDGQFYMVFVQKNAPVFMRLTKGDGTYETVWTATTGTPI